MFKRFLYGWLVGLMLTSPLQINSAPLDGDIETWTGMGARRNTEEFKVNEPTVGTAADFIPGTDNTNSLGTSALRFDDVQTYDLTVADDLTVTDDAAISGDLTTAGLIVETPVTYTIGAGTSVTPTSSFGVFTTTGGAITSTATPFLATTTFSNGTLFTVFSSTTDNIVLDDEDNTTGTLLEFHQNRTSLTLSNPGDHIVLRYYSGKWYEVSFSTH